MGSCGMSPQPREVLYVPSDVWTDVLCLVRRDHPQLVRAWFRTLVPASITGGVLEVHTSNTAQSRYLQHHCGRAFAQAAQAVTGQLLTVRFETNGAPSETDPETAVLDDYDDGLVLNADYHFDHFVTGPCNRLAHAAATAVANSPGSAYNPLFLHGPVGLGKTHLMQAICHRVRAEHPGARCSYITCELFVNLFIESVERGALRHFRHRFRDVDVLVIDDIQFLAKRERSQEEFFHTFNMLHQFHRQIVMSADCPPAEIASLQERLTSRFNSGLVACVEKPCLETRIAIVRKKAALRCIEIPDDVAVLIAERVDSNIRELDGALIKVDAYSQVAAAPITRSLAQQALANGTQRPVGIPAIIEAVARKLEVKVSDLQGRKRSKAITLPRHICMFLARELTSHSLEQIGGYLGGRDHTTVLHASRAVRDQLQTDAELSNLLDDIRAGIQNAG